jgi:hypothetical protein
VEHGDFDRRGRPILERISQPSRPFERDSDFSVFSACEDLLNGIERPPTRESYGRSRPAGLLAKRRSGAETQDERMSFRSVYLHHVSRPKESSVTAVRWASVQ